MARGSDERMAAASASAEVEVETPSRPDCDPTGDRVPSAPVDHPASRGNVFGFDAGTGDGPRRSGNSIVPVGAVRCAMEGSRWVVRGEGAAADCRALDAVDGAFAAVAAGGSGVAAAGVWVSEPC